MRNVRLRLQGVAASPSSSIRLVALAVICARTPLELLVALRASVIDEVDCRGVRTLGASGSAI